MKHMHSRVRSYGSDVMDCVDVSRKTTILLMMIGACWGIPGANTATSNGQRTGHALKTPGELQATKCRAVGFAHKKKKNVSYRQTDKQNHNIFCWQFSVIPYLLIPMAPVVIESPRCTKRHSSFSSHFLVLGSRECEIIYMLWFWNPTWMALLLRAGFKGSCTL